MDVNDIVTRKSHNHDIFFKIVRVKSDGTVDLKGIALRLLADAPISDLVKVNSTAGESLPETREKLISCKKRSSFFYTYAYLSSLL